MHVLLADQSTRMRAAIHFVLDQQPQISSISLADNTATLIEQLERLHPHLILIAWELWRVAMSELLLAFQTASSSPKLIVFSSRSEVRQAALNSGADAFLCAYDPPEKLLELLQTALIPQP